MNIKKYESIDFSNYVKLAEEHLKSVTNLSDEKRKNVLMNCMAYYIAEYKDSEDILNWQKKVNEDFPDLNLDAFFSSYNYGKTNNSNSVA